jgi:hypothetical protein
LAWPIPVTVNNISAVMKKNFAVFIILSSFNVDQLMLINVTIRLPSTMVPVVKKAMPLNDLPEKHTRPDGS